MEEDEGEWRKRMIENERIIKIKKRQNENENEKEDEIREG